MMSNYRASDKIRRTVKALHRRRHGFCVLLLPHALCSPLSLRLPQLLPVVQRRQEVSKREGQWVRWQQGDCVAVPVLESLVDAQQRAA